MTKVVHGHISCEKRREVHTGLKLHLSVAILASGVVYGNCVTLFDVQLLKDKDTQLIMSKMFGFDCVCLGLFFDLFM